MSLMELALRGAIPPEPFQATTYTAPVIPEGHYLRRYDDLVGIHVIKVEWRSEGRWAVIDRFGNVYSKTLRKRHEPMNSGRSEYFLATFRHDLRPAFDIAQRARSQVLAGLERRWPDTPASDTGVSPLSYTGLDYVTDPNTQENPK